MRKRFQIESKTICVCVWKNKVKFVLFCQISFFNSKNNNKIEKKIHK